MATVRLKPACPSEAPEVNRRHAAGGDLVVQGVAPYLAHTAPDVHCRSMIAES